MATITIIIIIILIGLFAFRQFFKKQSVTKTLIDKFTSKPLTITNRLIYYALLAGLSIITPYILTMIFLIATGDRIEGMKLGVFPGLITVHLIFGLIFIKSNWLKKTLWTIILTTLAFGLALLSLKNEIIKTNWDIYGYWNLSVTNFLAGLIIWETYFQINERLKETRNG